MSPQDAAIVCLSAAQLSGVACARCHRLASEARMVPLRDVAGMEFLGATTTLFVCADDCRRPYPVGGPR